VIQSGHSALVIGEAGSGIEEFWKAIYKQFEPELTCAIVIYKGSTKVFFKSLAEQLDIPTEAVSFNEEGEDEGGKPLTVDELKEEILSNLTHDTLIILPEAKRLPASVRYWLEDAISNEVRIVCFSPVNPGRDIFLSLLEVELELPDDRSIREVMEQEAKKLGLTLSQSKLAELQPLAGRNPMLARKVVQRQKLGMRQDQVQHTQYIVIMPIILAALFSFAVVRFIGLGTNNKGLYITGGMALTVAMGLKQLGRVQGSRRKLGQ
jgi:hypothetical protein